ncbi:hypothetical protein Ancab_018949 [Ancistrocladus abbreviatus]
MGENDLVRFTGSLDPAAQEFRPGYPTTQFQLIPQQVYYPYNPAVAAPSLTAPPPYPHIPHYGSPVPAAYVASNQPPLPPPLPAPSPTPTRALLLSSVPTDVSESTVRRELEVFGDVRAVQMERVREGIVTVHFYDLRAAHAAMDEIREQHMQHQNRLRIHYTTAAVLARNHNGYTWSDSFVGPPPPPPPLPACGLISGRPVWAQFMIPAINAFPDGLNQGTLVLFNLDCQISSSSLREIFEAFGPVKELRETPLKKHQRFVEFYDVRDAAKALAAMNGKEIHGKNVMIEYSRPGGHGKRFYSSSSHPHFSRPPKTTPPPSPPPPPPPPSQPLSPPSPSSLRRPSRRAMSNLPPRAALKRSSSLSGKRGHRISSSSSSSESVEGFMSGLTLREGDEERGICGHGRKNVRKSGGNHSKQQQQQQQLQQLKGRSKGRQRNFDPRFLIKEAAIEESNCRDSRTTVMIKNIPNKYSQKLLLNMLDNHCIHCNEQIADGDDQPVSSYDFLYLPIDFNNKCNVGYGFVNMTSPEATLRLYKAFHKQHWEVFNSRKICEVTYARVQGLEALKEHFKNSKFACETEEYLPVVFSPPRDGRRVLTDPLPIVGLTHITNLHLDDKVDDGVDGGDATSPTASTSTATCTATITTAPVADHHHQHHPILINHENDSDGYDRDDVVIVAVGSCSSLPNGGDMILDYDRDSNISSMA